ncbi:alanine/glycine:cation symporter family protein [Anaerostipes sp.]|uniref:alanine/glycine:cation symporter family protein n=1 Tax=Anaerostipes sp. TaxID=1872530 RepID=UPI0025BD6BDC|nr:sodium:alanine symporter family protein [Anaerostipes sp.]MBS7006886.1 sodium:alanine symporter family protein [Anaerostipes sp.]
MEQIFSLISRLNSALNSFIWGTPMLACFLGIGLMFTFRTNFFQLRHFRLWFSSTFLSSFRKSEVRKTKDSASISQFQSLCTALAGTLGTGNIAGVATAITAGGPGAVFWMWISSVLGMMTHYAEVTLGMKYRYKDKNGNWAGGAMVYMERGLHSKWLASLFAMFCILASLGIGNMAQANSMSSALSATFSISPVITGLAGLFLVGFVIMGGIKRIASVTEKVIPVMAALFTLGCIIIIVVHIDQLPSAFHSIFHGAFSPKAAGGGVLGYGITAAMKKGISRGVFSNEAGLGSSVTVHTNSDTKEPVVQGMWGIFEVFTDTVVMCTITALTILTSGVYAESTYLNAMALDAVQGTTAHFDSLLNGVPLTSAAFSTVFGPWGAAFVAIAIVFFAFSTLIGWSFYGETAVAYLFGKRAVTNYKLVFLYFIFLGSILHLSFVWNLSDTFNGLMAVPNLISITLLSGQVIKMTNDYLTRR